ncbi:hypothetical protein T01_11044 [Trichinella spiralis]|uniref:Uncharacterized protein n=1 Tax=Trichinella spiralis TaxID=6334 RepID=A0A0V1B5T2_TRISP|nr:hypothetical protein T01_4183 [Trichinella spiralis]KRY34082.1 hypothetical protein T01_11044 [Trichinella spiralis]
MSYFGRWSLAKAAANNSLPVVLDLMGISIFMKPEPAARKFRQHETDMDRAKEIIPAENEEEET